MTETEEASAMKAAWVVLLLVVLAVPGFAQAPDDKLIVPGQRIGKWTLAMTIDDLLRMNGPRNGRSMGLPALSHAVGTEVAADLWAHRWLDRGLVALTIGEKSQVVVELMMVLSEYKTDKGIGVGSSKEAMQSAYGSPTAAVVPRSGWRTALYDKIGFTVALGPSNTASYVTVFRPGTAKQLYKF
jgi:hypothetical protein